MKIMFDDKGMIKIAFYKNVKKLSNNEIIIEPYLIKGHFNSIKELSEDIIIINGSVDEIKKIT